MKTKKGYTVLKECKADRLAGSDGARSETQERGDGRRTVQELAAAVAYLGLMEEHSKHDKQKGKLVGKVAAKGREMLLWAAGEDNAFGVAITPFLRAYFESIRAPSTPDLSPQSSPTTKDPQ
jgi:hypothetical protein